MGTGNRRTPRKDVEDIEHEGKMGAPPWAEQRRLEAPPQIGTSEETWQEVETCPKVWMRMLRLKQLPGAWVLHVFDKKMSAPLENEADKIMRMEAIVKGLAGTRFEECRKEAVEEVVRASEKNVGMDPLQDRTGILLRSRRPALPKA